MFKVIESLSESPVRLIAAPDRKFEAGWIAQPLTIDGIVVCNLSDGSSPIGIIANSITSGENLSFRVEDMIEVYLQRMVFRTDQYELNGTYKTGVPLFVSPRGLLTSDRAHEDEAAVARVITGPDNKRAEFEAIWF